MWQSQQETKHATRRRSMRGVSPVRGGFRPRDERRQPRGDRADDEFLVHHQGVGRLDLYLSARKTRLSGGSRTRHATKSWDLPCFLTLKGRKRACCYFIRKRSSKEDEVITCTEVRRSVVGREGNVRNIRSYWQDTFNQVSSRKGPS